MLENPRAESVVSDWIDRDSWRRVLRPRRPVSGEQPASQTCGTKLRARPPKRVRQRHLDGRTIGELKDHLGPAGVEMPVAVGRCELDPVAGR